METHVITIAGVLVAVLLMLLFVRRRRRKMSTSRGITRPRHDPLLTACLGDAAKAQRLAEYERRRHPYLSMEQARQLAYEKLTEDRRR